MTIPRAALALMGVITLSSCVLPTPSREEVEYRSAETALKRAGGGALSAEERAVLYLESAQKAHALLRADGSNAEAREIYNTAAAQLTVLLAGDGRGLGWNRPVSLTSGGTSYRLRFARPTSGGVLDPSYFTSFTPAADVDLKNIEQRNQVDGIGGCLVGVHKTTPREQFAPKVGVTAPVTALLDFNGNKATLTLVDPVRKSTARTAGRDFPLAADFSAPLAYYPQESELWNGIMGALQAEKNMGMTGLYQLEPYDRDRIPVVLVHGLISTPRMWRNVINELETDPVLRRRYQFWVFGYPTGNPPAYSAMRLREELQKLSNRHPDMKDIVLVGHSMGGILSRMQVINLDRRAWDAIGEDKAAQLFRNVQPGDLIHRSTIYQANPRIARVVFICTPHRGSKMAVGTLGELAIRLISVPREIATTTRDKIGSSLAIVTGDPDRSPTSIDGLSPRNPAFKALDSRPIVVPHHSIIGDRGKGDTPESSDGVVEYWSSHMKSARSEKIVPGPHGACEIPETLDELRRILHLHLKSN